MVRLELLIDHTLLKPDATRGDIERLCEEAIREGFFGVCVNPCWVGTVFNLLRNTAIKVISVAGFPLGSNNVRVKMAEIERALSEGADEIDMVMNVGFFKSGYTDRVLEEIRWAKDICGDKILKVIIETPLLKEDEKERAALLVEEGGADFVKTCTGFFGGVKLEDVKLLRKCLSKRTRIKAAGGIRTRSFALALVEAGADRLGASRSLEILSGSN